MTGYRAGHIRCISTYESFRSKNIGQKYLGASILNTKHHCSVIEILESAVFINNFFR